MACDAALPPEDLQLLDRLAARVVELRLEIPAILTLETGKPLSLIAGQTMVFFEPMVQAMFSFPDYRRFAALIERREVIEMLIRKIEQEADRVHTERRARRNPRKPPADAPPPA